MAINKSYYIVTHDNDFKDIKEDDLVFSEQVLL